MKRTVALILTSLLVAPPVSADQKLGPPLDWEKVTGLKAGTEIMLALSDAPPVKVKLLFADNSILVTLRPDTPKLPGKVQRALVAVGSRWPAILNRADSVTFDQVRVSPDGVFDRDQEVAELAAMVQQTPRGAVRGIWEPAHSHLSRNIVIVGAIAAIGVVVFIVVRNAILDAIAN